MNTLRYHLDRAVFQKRDMGHVPVGTVAKSLCAEVITGMVAPEREAIRFYLLNHALADIRLKYALDEPLDQQPNEVVRHIVRSMNEISIRLFYYLILICVRESRHIKMTQKYKNAVKKFGPYREWNHSFNDYGEGGGAKKAVDAVKYHAPDMNMRDFTQALVTTFYKGVFNVSYGGRAWGAVADVLRDFVHGTISAEAMVDTGWTLCHNNGPIFNKGMYYTQYTKSIYMILDVQRGGQIPHLVSEYVNYGVAHTGFESGVEEDFYFLSSVAGWLDNRYVDWYEVEALGALHSYNVKKKEQIKKYGDESESAKKAAEAYTLKKLQDEAAAIKYKKEWFEVGPNNNVKKIHPVREAG